MKILAIIGSPRGEGNSLNAVKQIEKNMKAYSNEIEFSYLFLKEANLASCRGCQVCFTGKGESSCPLQDDRAGIEGQMLASDGVIFASPVYALNITGLMKNFMDRFAYAAHRPRFFKQYGMAVATTGGKV